MEGTRSRRVDREPEKIEKRTWCFFDLDGTLLRRKSFPPFLLGWVLKHPRRLVRLVSLPFNLARWLCTGRKRVAFKEIFLTACMGGARRDEIERYVSEFWDAFLPLYQNDDMVSRLRWHHESGHSIYIVTSSFDFYTEYLLRIWPVKGLVATRAEWKADILTGRTVGGECHGLRKIRRIREDLGLDIQNIRYYAYSDSEADLPLLMSTRYGFLVKASKLLPWEREA